MTKTKKLDTKSYFIAGLQLKNKNDFIGAKAALQKALDINPHHFDSLYLLGVIASIENNLILAQHYLNSAHLRNPSHLECNFNLAVLTEKLGNFEAAHSQYANILTAQPNHIPSLFNLGCLMVKIREPHKALEIFKQVYEIQPSLIKARHYYEQLLSEINDAQELSVSATHNTNNPNLSDYIHHHEIGMQHLNQHEFKEAISQFNIAIKIIPENPEAHHNKAMALEKMGNLQQALDIYRVALNLKNDSATTLNNIGNICRELGSYNEALTYFYKALAINTNYAEAYNNLGWTYYEMRDFKASLESYTKAININPNLSAAKFNLGLCQLMLGDYVNGWKNYEYRKSQPLYNLRELTSSGTEWSGSENITDRTIYIYTEQGLGDTIQFCRYLKPLANMGAKVLFKPQPELSNLLKNLAGVERLLHLEEKIPEHEFQCSLLSLPLALNAYIGTIPPPTIQLSNSKLAELWKKKIVGIKSPKVGIVWSGGHRQNQPELWAVNKRRNISFELISQLNLDHIEFFSLQKGSEAELDLAGNITKLWPNGNLHNFTSDISDFIDTAALIVNLDLVISVDTSTAHLAGSLNVPVWILNRFDGCWRWQSKNSRTDWYPSATLYRQATPGNWIDVITTVREDLLKLFPKAGA